MARFEVGDGKQPVRLAGGIYRIDAPIGDKVPPNTTKEYRTGVTCDVPLLLHWQRLEGSRFALRIIEPGNEVVLSLANDRNDVAFIEDGEAICKVIPLEP